MVYQIKRDDEKNSIQVKLLPLDQTGDIGMESKGRIALYFLERVGVCDGVPSTVF